MIEDAPLFEEYIPCHFHIQLRFMLFTKVNAVAVLKLFYHQLFEMGAMQVLKVRHLYNAEFKNLVNLFGG